jgi:hypothetical protein
VTRAQLLNIAWRFGWMAKRALEKDSRPLDAAVYQARAELAAWHAARAV